LVKRKIPWSTVFLCAVIGLPVAFWTYTIVRDGFVSWAIFPGLFGGFFVFGGLAMLFTGDDSKDPKTKSDASEAVAAPKSP
jgi:hypothetical protein